MSTDIAKITIFKDGSGRLAANVETPGHDFGDGKLETGTMRFSADSFLPESDRAVANDFFLLDVLMEKIRRGLATRVVGPDVWVKPQ